MDIEINEVQEIIKNLESSGELSIKEEKYLKVAKLCVQLAAFRLAAMDSEPVAENIRIADALEGLLWPNMAIGNKAVIQAAIEALRAYHAQPAPVSLTEAHVAALEEEERSFHDAIRKCIASLRYHHKRAEAHSAGYKGSTLEDDTLKSINLLKRNITAAMLNGGKP